MVLFYLEGQGDLGSRLIMEDETEITRLFRVSGLGPGGLSK